MAKKNKYFDDFTIIAIVFICLAVAYFLYSFFMGMRSPAPPFSTSLGQFKSVNTTAISAVKELNACGLWPIAGTSLSAERGNPFNRKDSVQSKMVATSSIFCLPVTQ